MKRELESRVVFLGPLPTSIKLISKFLFEECFSYGHVFACMWTHLCVGAHACVYVCLWTSDIDVRDHPPSIFSLIH